jgi:phenylpropionate dioxygenase-like ring-hydroxylating dioxygenase large terminal subunit
LQLFASDLYEGVRRALPEATTLPARCYTDPSFLEREVERIFLNSWCFVARLDEVARVGDFMAINTIAGPLLILRDADGCVRSFVNACRHRGCKLLEGRGQARAVVCPYHGWTYSLRGELLSARHMEQTANFQRERYGLTEVRTETWDGFIFINYDGTGPSLRDHLGNMPEQFASHDCANMTCVRRIDFDVRCNWKLILENALEDYHTRSVHRASIGTQTAIRERTTGQWDSLFVEGNAPVGTLPGESSPFPVIGALRGRARYASYFTIVYPNTQFCFTQDCMWWLSVTPVTAATSRLETGYCFPQQTVARNDFAEVLERYLRRWRLTAEEDIKICEMQQLGLEARFRVPGPLSWKEDLVKDFDRWVIDRVVPSQDAPAQP